MFCANRIKYFKKPDWFKELDDVQASEQQQQQDDKFSFEVSEMFKIDGNTESFFRQKHKWGVVIKFSIYFVFC